METGRCPACSRAYTSGEVTGLGILRSRPEESGGPLVEFACPGCGRRLVLVPHGRGRFAPPGQPPPPDASEADRRPPWSRPDRPETATPPRERSRAARKPPPRPAADPPPAAPAPPPTASFREALEVLGVGPEADAEAIDRAFRERSLLCHPDKVAHLDEDFQALAAAKFRRLKAAHDLLSGRVRPSRNS